MPSLRESGDELSLRHLPDVSDSSFSFQIPAPATGDYLLADIEVDFFRGADNIIGATPAISKTTQDALTLSQLTPGPDFEKPASFKRQFASPLPSMPLQQLRPQSTKAVESNISLPKSSNAGSKTSIIRKDVIAERPQTYSGEGTPIAARFTSLRAEVDSLAGDTQPGPSATVEEARPTIEASRRGMNVVAKSGDPREIRQEKVHSKPYQTVIQGGITKTRSKKPISFRTQTTSNLPAPPVQAPSIVQQPSSSEMDVYDDSINADISVSSATEGVAGRLVMYSQKLINSFGLFNVDKPSGPIGDPGSVGWQSNDATSSAVAAKARVSCPNDIKPIDPLTLSQLSPRKTSTRSPSPSALTTSSPPTSLLRLSAKRPVPSTTESEPARKKGKTASSSNADAYSQPSLAGASSSSSRAASNNESIPGTHSSTNDNDADGTKTRTRTRVRRQPRHAPTTSSTSTSVMSRAKAKLRASERTRLAPGNKSGNTQRHGAPAVSLGSVDSGSSLRSSSRSGKTSTTRRADERVADPASSRSQRDGADGSGDRRVIAPLRKSVKSTVPNAPAVPTKPVEFNFQLDARLEGKRKTEPGASSSSESVMQKQQQQHSKSLSSSASDYKASIPNFKSMHAAQEAALAHRKKENIHPVIPLPIEFATDLRMKERQKFDERVKAREREMEKAAEERRREREEEEEREVRELRKRAVPRANEVPEWYKEAPKKKSRGDLESSVR
ncbi:hypothetical protein BDQ12DRAFT_732909 [Crucibulum laeve]|uniref:TPX2 C-terminal domain-containing protein n=1 Tax=Crucibulum laeve TaxID=68775 RepID=A0A5C3MBT9_9AGAR|nr:hypothetical protein BDQ12DRAFT_732909 [Crucibulum laeve]